MSETFPDDVAESIITHMNDDHADAVLAIAAAHTDAPDIDAARLLSISPACLDIETRRGVTTARLSVAFEPPISPLDTVRERLVQLTREARAIMKQSADAGT